MSLFAIRGGKMGADEYRVLNKPRARIAFADQVPHGAGVAANATYSSTTYDTDSMTNGTSYITCRTPGLYAVWAQMAWAGGGVANTWSRIIVNDNVLVVVGMQTESRDLSVWGNDFSIPGWWVANAGDRISLYQYSSIGVNLTDQALGACLISTLG